MKTANYAAYAEYLNGNPFPKKLAPTGAAHYAHIVFGVPKATAKRIIIASLKPVALGKATFYGNETHTSINGPKAVVSYAYYSVDEINKLFTAG